MYSRGSAASGPSVQHDNVTKVAGRGTYDDAREADERQHEGHVGLGSGDATARLECIDGLPAAQDPHQQQALVTNISVYGRAVLRNDDRHWIRPTRAAPAGKKQKKCGGSLAAYAGGLGEATYICAHASVILLRSLLFLCGMDAARVGPYYGRSVLKVGGRFVVEGVGVGFLCDHLDVHAGLRVLDDRA